MRQIEDTLEIVGRRQLLNSEHRKILSDAVAEDGAECSDIESSAVADADDRLVIHLISDSRARREVPKLFFTKPFQRRAIDTGDHHLAGIDVDPASLAGSGHCLRVINFPAQPIIYRELGRDAPGILPVKELPVLPLTGIQRIRNVSLKAVDVANQVAGQAQSAAIGSARRVGIGNKARRTGADRSARAGFANSGSRRRT